MIIYTKRLYMFLGLLGCLLFTFGGIFLTLKGDFLGYLVILFFGIVCIPVYIYLLIRPKMKLAFSEKGLCFMNKLDVGWDNVVNLSLKEFKVHFLLSCNSFKYIAVNTYNPISTSKSCKALYGCDCAIMLMGTGANINEVYNEMNKYLSEYKEKSNRE